MNFILILISFFISIANLYWGISIIRVNSKDNLYRTFFALTVLFAIWSFGVVFLLNAPELTSVFFWYRFSAVAWIIIPPAALHFILLLTHPERNTRHHWIYLLLYFPATFFLFRLFTDTFLVSGFVRGEWGWVEVMDSNFWVWAFVLYSGLLVITALILIFRWRKHIENRKEILLFRIIFLTGLVAGMLSIIMELILPPLKAISIPTTGHITASVWIFGIHFALVRYRLMVLTPDMIYQELVTNMTDIMIIISDKGLIKSANPQFETVVGIHSSQLVDKKIDGYFEEKDLLNALIQSHRDHTSQNRYEMNVTVSGREPQPYSIYLTHINDRSGDSAGLMILGRDIGDFKRMERESSERKKMEVELRYAHHELGLKHQELQREKNKLKFRNENMENELAMARKIQRELIPSESPIPNLSFFYRPMEKIGGDFYDFIKFKMSDQIGIFLSDVSGHGVPAAFIATMMKAFMLQFGELLDNPEEFLIRLNEFLLNKTGGNFVTAFYGIYHTKTHRLLYANAGHLSPILIQDGSVTELSTEGRGIPLGVMPNHEIAFLNKLYENREANLPVGSKILIYTDGLTEAGNIYDPSRLYEDERLYPLLEQSNFIGHKELLNTLYQDLVDFRQSNSFEDDVCMVCLEVK